MKRFRKGKLDETAASLLVDEVRILREMQGFNLV